MFSDVIENKIHEWVDARLAEMEIRIQRRLANMLLNDANVQETALKAKSAIGPPPTEGPK